MNGTLVGFFPVIASAYIGEVCPVVLRGIMGSMVNLGFVVGRELSLLSVDDLADLARIDCFWAVESHGEHDNRMGV